MAHWAHPDHKVVYPIAERWVDFALRKDDSLFTPGTAIWASYWLDELHERFVGRPDESSDRFEVKLKRQLADASPQAIQLMGEVLYAHLLIARPTSITGTRKREIVEDVLRWMPEPVRIPHDLASVLDHGLAATGTAFATYRPFLLQLIIEFAREWKEQDPDERERLLRDPWAFRAFVYSVPLPRGAHSQREAILHLVHPDAFERIVSREAKLRIARTFSALVSEPDKNVDWQLYEIRQKLAEEHGQQLDFWQPEIRRQWQPDTSPWGQFIRWAARFYTQPDFDSDERDYKLEIAEHLAKARDAVLVGGDWHPLLKRSFGPPNNLTAFQMHGSFLKWCEVKPEAAEPALTAMWSPESTTSERIRTFLGQVPVDVVRGRGSRTTLASFLMMAVDAGQYPIYQTRAFAKAFELTEHSPPSADADEADIYEHALEFLDTLAAEASARGLELRDRLDAQSVLWTVVKPPVDDLDLPPREREALRRYRGGEVVDLEQDDETVASSTDAEAADLDALARELMLDSGWLRRVERLLQDKRQVVFYGPPGTGKTYVAQELAHTLAAGGGSVELVQFHPSYAYEDFVEGYRPASLKGGTPGFERKEGPLKRIAKAAAAAPEATHVLIIDEINRGNVAKIFGELYFLLEYRTRSITLQYSDDKFSLPENLWLICTMNSADRTIALLDAALRRRFHFVPFFPHEPPVEGLLRRWLQQHRPELEWVADVVDHANARLDERDLAIGPSHFLRHDLDDEWVRLIWDHSIVPYIQEQFFSEPERWQEFDFDKLVRVARPQRTSEPEGPDADASAE